MNERKHKRDCMFWKVAELKDAKLFCQSMNETEDVNIHSICLLKGIVLNRTVLCFPICSCFGIHKIPLILCLIALKIHESFYSRHEGGILKFHWFMFSQM